MHWYHVGNCQHQEECLWHWSLVIWSCIRKTLLIPQSRSHGSSPKGEIRINSWLPQEGRTRRQGLYRAQSYHIQQLSMLLPQNWESPNCALIFDSSSRTWVEVGPTKDISGYSFKSLCSSQPIGQALRCTSAFNALNYPASRLIFVKINPKVQGPWRWGWYQRWKISCACHCLS